MEAFSAPQCRSIVCSMVDRLADRDILNGVNTGSIGFPKPMDATIFPIAVEFEDAGVFSIVIGTADSEDG